ncbi:hypothetical protein [Bacillus sp. SRB_331]|uniref:hypothetical protein n=1 Tax=Bacillus sp. SRB_331 TaxID=1969379 RepID=UPI000DC50192|nr:hypothetical protein [Bacillus sp. SRB_331]RAN75985.1 hypothetical protein B5P42_24040 [Bacillus sp. SRB_331]
MEIIKNSLFFIISFLIKLIFSAFTVIKSVFASTILCIIFQYIFLFFIIILSLAVLQFITHGIRFKVLKYLYHKFIRNKNLKVIRLITELYYLSDKLLYFISPRVLYASAYREDNSVDKTKPFSPIHWYNSLKSFISTMFQISFVNILIWFIILLFYQPTLIQNITEILHRNNISNIIKHLDYKAINAVTGCLALLISTFTLILFRTTILTSKAKKKLYDERYEQVIKSQLKISASLSKCLYKSKQNINTLERQLDFITNQFCKKLTHSESYIFSNGKLQYDPRIKYYRSPNTIELFTCYNPLKKEVEEILDSLIEINNNSINNIYFKLNKHSKYEIEQLGINPLNTSLNLDALLLSQEFLSNTFTNMLNHYEHLNTRFIKIKELRSGFLSEEQFMKEYIYFSKSMEDIISMEENDLQEAVINFRNSLINKFEESIYYYVITQQYVNNSYKKSRLSLSDLFFGK